MFQSLAKELVDVIVIERGEDVAALLTEPHQAHLSQRAQLMGDSGLACPHGIRQLVDA
jgi:hypothetical protein